MDFVIAPAVFMNLTSSSFCASHRAISGNEDEAASRTGCRFR